MRTNDGAHGLVLAPNRGGRGAKGRPSSSGRRGGGMWRVDQAEGLTESNNTRALPSETTAPSPGETPSKRSDKGSDPAESAPTESAPDRIRTCDPLLRRRFNCSRETAGQRLETAFPQVGLSVRASTYVHGVPCPPWVSMN